MVPIQQAKHNSDVCDYLYSSGNYGDWVITTAYYSSIYFVCHELFPKQYDITGKPKRYSSFDEYYEDFQKSADRNAQLSAHKVRLSLVEEHMPEIAVEFKILKDNCWTARYTSYIVSAEKVELCRECLSKIKEVCEPVELTKSSSESQN